MNDFFWVFTISSVWDLCISVYFWNVLHLIMLMCICTEVDVGVLESQLVMVCPFHHVFSLSFVWCLELWQVCFPINAEVFLTPLSVLAFWFSPLGNLMSESSPCIREGWAALSGPTGEAGIPEAFSWTAAVDQKHSLFLIMMRFLLNLSQWGWEKLMLFLRKRGNWSASSLQLPQVFVLIYMST